jgi:hypothetical protein
MARNPSPVNFRISPPRAVTGPPVASKKSFRAAMTSP